MGYLNLPQGVPDFSKGLFSDWFRVPQESVDAAAAAGSVIGDEDPLAGLIPLWTWGRRQSELIYTPNTRNVAVPINFSPTSDGWQLFSTEWIAGGSKPLAPSYVGVRVFSDGSTALEINLQMSNRASLRGADFDVPSISVWNLFGDDVPSDTPTDPGSGWFGGFPLIAHNDGCVDTSIHYTGRPEYFFVRSKPITADHAHHVALAFDLSRACNTRAHDDGPTAAGTTSACKLWLALDDENLTGDDLGPYQVDGGGPNDILTSNAQLIASQPTGLRVRNLFVPDGVCSYRPAPMPSSNAPFGIPATSDIARNIYRVERRDFQFYSGKTLDWAVTANRRLFIDKDGKPTRPSVPRKFFGRKADIILRGRGNWKAGRNTGELSGGKTVEQLAAGMNFNPTGDIESWTPELTLHGPQSPGER